VTRRRRWTIALIALGLLASSGASIPNDAKVPGHAETWLYHFKGLDGKEQTNILKVRRQAEDLTGTLKLAGEDSVLRGGKVEKDGTISFTSTFTTTEGEPFDFRCRGRAQDRMLRLQMEMIRDGRRRLVSIVEFERDPAEK